MAEQDDLVAVDEEGGVHMLAEREDFPYKKLTVVFELFAVEE